MRRILGVDPGGTSDGFAIVLIEVEDDNTIRVLGAKQWTNVTYHKTVEDEIKQIVKNKRINELVIERNAKGEPIEQTLKYEYQLPVIGIWTTSNVKEPKANVMDKAAMVDWMIRQQEGESPKLVWADSTSDYMKEAKRQWSIFGEYKKGKFEAPPGGHDDFVMALMLACYQAKRYIDSGGLAMINANRIHEEKKWDYLKQDHDEGKTGLMFERS